MVKPKRKPILKGGDLVDLYINKTGNCWIGYLSIQIDKARKIEQEIKEKFPDATIIFKLKGGK